MSIKTYSPVPSIPLPMQSQKRRKPKAKLPRKAKPRRR